MKTNYFICSVLVFLLFPLILLKAQPENDPFVFDPPSNQPLGVISNGSLVTITFDVINVGSSPRTYFIDVGPLQAFNPWITSIEPDDPFTVNYYGDGITVELSGTFIEPSNFGYHTINVVFRENDWPYDYVQTHTISYTSIQSSGIEDYIAFTSFVNEFNELDVLHYSCQFYDEEPFGDYITDWNFKIMLYTTDNEEYTYIDIDKSCCLSYAEWHTVPLLPSNLAFIRNENGQIYGIATVTAIDNTSWTHIVSLPLAINKEPDPPILQTIPGEDNTVNIIINNSGGIENLIHYGFNSGEPYTGTGLVQGDSPIDLGSATNIELEGFIDCSKYFFAATATNQYGTSDYSNERVLTFFSSLNGYPIHYHLDDCYISQGYGLEGNHYFGGSLIIESGANIEISGGILYFEENSKIIIKPGGKLILNGTTCTAPCGQTWMGIEVWGDPDKHQYTLNDVCLQGILEMKGGATIENAVIGVLLASKDANGNIENAKTGGIIRIDFDGNPEEFEANFINNQRAIFFYDYKNYNPFDPNEREISNLSFIENSYFDINQDYLMGDWWHSHIYLYKVSGVKIRGNTFINNEANIPSGHGINSYNAGYRVEAICDDIILPCPESSLLKNKFWNFTKGINLVNTSTYALIVKDAEFHNNSNGVILTRVDNATVIFNDFFLGKCSDSDDQKCDGKGAAYGINMTSCTGFKVEENKFEKESGAPAGHYVGLRVTDCASESEIIYRNQFNGVSIGNFAAGANRILGMGSNTGLTYHCNENTGNTYDFYVADNSFISGFVGGYDKPSGNTLSSAAQVQFQNDYTEPVLYFFNQNAANEVLTLHSDYVVPLGINDENTCPSNYGGAGVRDPRVVLTETERQEVELEYLQNYNDYNNVKTLYANLQDGGSTESLIAEVETSWPHTMWELRAELLGNSPHLSQQVLKTAADKTDVLPESVLFEILSANPDELRREELISYLENKQDPLPQYMIDILKQLANGSTYKTVLMSEMASYHTKKVKAAQDIITSILNEEEPDFSELRDWYDNIGGIEADKKIIETFIIEGDILSAQSLLDIIPALYELYGDQLIAYNDYKTYTELIIDLETEERSIYNLDTAELATLLTMAEYSSGTAKASAQGILEFAYGYDFYNCPDLPSDIQLKSAIINMDDLAKARGLKVSVEPNPASTWTAIDYTLPVAEYRGLIEITDNLGRVIKQVEISNQTGQYILDTRDFKTGIYYYAIKCNDVQRTGKLIIR
jgi:hypothetical protein